MNVKEFDRWFRIVILGPAKAHWGTGWIRLSPEMRAAEVKASCFQNLLSQARLEEPELDLTNAAAVGHHVASVVAAYRRWANEQTE